MVTESQFKDYPPDSAARLAVTNVPTVDKNTSVAEIEKVLIKEAVNFDAINYIYILDKAKKLKGVVSVKEIFRSSKTKIAKDLSSKKLIIVHGDTDQEQVVHLALKNNLKAIPVVSKDSLFLGVVPGDVILRTLHHETTEDILRLGGITHTTHYDNIFSLPLITSLKHRVPWLIVGLVGGIFAAGIVSQFEEVLSRNLILAAFLPLIVYMAEAVGTQMEAFILRDFAVNPKLRFVKYFAKQSVIVFIIGFGISGLLYVVSLMLYNLPLISFVLSTALFFAILTSLFTGLIIPFIFSRLRFDPANASGPVATIIQDVLSISVYFFIASLIL